MHSLAYAFYSPLREKKSKLSFSVDSSVKLEGWVDKHKQNF